MNRENRLPEQTTSEMLFDYANFLKGLKERIQQAQLRAGLAVNHELVLL